MQINWKVRAKSVQFWLGMFGVVMSPILAYFGLTYEDLTSWEMVGSVFMRFIQNPFLIGTVVVAVLGAIGVITDPTTSGLGDSANALNRIMPAPNSVDADLITNATESEDTVKEETK